MKTCKRCTLPKPETAFHRSMGRKDGLQNICKTCKSSDKRIQRTLNDTTDQETPLSPLMTQAEVAQALGVSRSLVYLDEKSAFKKIRKALASIGIYSAEDFCV
jgi:hypothetical protein